MVEFRTNLEVIFADEKEIAQYYEIACKKLNLLLEQHNILNGNNKHEKVCAEELRAPLTARGFFKQTPLKSIFYSNKQQFIPSEIVDIFRNIVSDPPTNIKAVLYDTFLKLLREKGWAKPLSTYFEKKYNFPSDGIIILEDLKDFSFGYS